MNKLAPYAPMFYSVIPSIRADQFVEQALVVYATGLDWIDLEDYCSTTVAEHAIGLMLNFSRKLYLGQLKSINAIPQSVSLQGFDLCGKTLGVLVTGAAIFLDSMAFNYSLQCIEEILETISISMFQVFLLDVISLTPPLYSLANREGAGG